MRATVLLLSVWFLACNPAPQLKAQRFADYVVTGGTIMTMDATRPQVEAVAIAGDRILAVGNMEEVRRYINADTGMIEVPDEHMVIPGLIEGHGHFLGLGQSLMMLNLADAKSWDEIVDRVAVAAKTTPPGQWIIGRGWHQSKWSEMPQPNVGGYPTTERLDQVTQNHPVMLTHASGHMSFANSYAMRLAGVDSNTADPEGGEILKNDQGTPIGVFRETAQGLVGMAMSRDERQRTISERRSLMYRAVELAGQECLKHGITSFQDAGSSFPEIRMFRELALDQKLPVRLYVMVRDSNEGLRLELPQLKAIGVGQDFFTCRSLKRSIDGALGPHGAWLLAPYNDLPTSSGLNTASVESVRETAEIAAELDFQLCVHAIGDRANQETLNIFEEVFRRHPTNRSRRWRVEHAQHLSSGDIGRFAELGVIASMQGVHCTSDAIFVLQRLGMARAESGAYVWRSLLDSGAIVTNGTDAPVEAVNPFPSLAASITRELSDGSTFFPAQCMTREEALRSYTIDCAYAAFEETLKGSLVPGKLADLVVVDRNLLTCPPREIASTQVVKTILAGKVVYEWDGPEKE